MIKLTKIDGTEIVVNADEIETVETQHDSNISLRSGKKLLVKESADEIILRVILYRQKCFAKLGFFPQHFGGT